MAEIFSNISIVFNQQSYISGQPMSATLSGSAVNQQPLPPATLTLALLDPSTNATGSVTAPVPQVIGEVSESVIITGAVDSSGRQWTVASGGLSVTAVA